jgi:hypothetical protein
VDCHAWPRAERKLLCGGEYVESELLQDFNDPLDKWQVIKLLHVALTI